MLDNEPTDNTSNSDDTGHGAGGGNPENSSSAEASTPAKKAARKAPAKRAPRKTAPRKTAAQKAAEAATAADPSSGQTVPEAGQPTPEAQPVPDAQPAAPADAQDAGNTDGSSADTEAPAEAKPKRAPRARKTPAKKAAAKSADGGSAQIEGQSDPVAGETSVSVPASSNARADDERDQIAPADAAETPAQAPARKAPAKRAPRKRTSKAAAAEVSAAVGTDAPSLSSGAESTPADSTTAETTEFVGAPASQPTLSAPAVLFQPPVEAQSSAEFQSPVEAQSPVEVDAPVERKAPSRRRRGSAKAAAAQAAAAEAAATAAEPATDLPIEDADPAELVSARDLALGETPGADDVLADSDLDADADTDDATDLDADTDADGEAEAEDSGETGSRRRRRRGRRGRGNRSTEDATEPSDISDPEGVESDEQGELTAEDDEAGGDEDEDEDHADAVAEAAMSASARRRRRRRRSTSADGADSAEALAEDDPPNTVVHVRDTTRESREGRGSSRGSAADEDGVRGVKGSTRLEAKRQRRRDNRDSGRRRAPILTEAEFLARREAVDRVMAVRQAGDRTQIAVLEDDILVEHYVTRASASSAVGNVYLGRVQNVLPSMEAAFIDIGRGRNGVLYAGEVNWDVAGLEGKARSIENALSPGDTVLVQVTKDPIGHKGARLTSQISLPGRFVVYVPGGGMTGISRKLPDVERSRLKAILKKVVPDEAGVIVRTAAEGATEDDLVSDVERLKTEWEAISQKAERTKQSGDGPLIVHGEPDLAIRVVRDIFNDDFRRLVVAGSDIHRTLTDYVSDIAPELADRIALHTGESDLFRDLRVDEQLAKALDRKVWLPSGGSLVIDRTEAMTVVDVNTGKYTGSGGNLEQTVTRNNLEAAEEIVRQLRLRDIGGIVVIDFIDMVLESNRDLVLRRLTECLGRDRTKHQVAEVTSLGLVQMTRKRVGEGLLEAFSEPCEHCKGRGVILHLDPVEQKQQSSGTSDAAAPGSQNEERTGRGRRNRKGRSEQTSAPEQPDQASLAAEEEKRRSAASAIAAIAAATNGHETASPSLGDDRAVGTDAPNGDAPNGDPFHPDAQTSLAATVPPISIGTSVAEAAVAADQGYVTDGSTADGGAGNQSGANGRRAGRRRATSRGTVRPVEGDAAAERAVVQVAELIASTAGDETAGQRAAETVTGTASVPATAPPRPKRRRAASRPAGPPVGVPAAEG